MVNVAIYHPGGAAGVCTGGAQPQHCQSLLRRLAGLAVT